MKSIYGNCSCGYNLEPVFFEEQEEKIYKDGFKVKTGRYRKAVSHLICENCGKIIPLMTLLMGIGIIRNNN